MHRLAATPGGWSPEVDGVIFVEQSPAPIVVLTAADTDIQCLARVAEHWPESAPALRVANLLQLQQQLAIDAYADTVLSQAQVIIVRLLGGRAYWSYGLEVVKAIAAENKTALIVLPGDDRPDPDLISHSTVPLTVAHELWRYLNEGGIDNWRYGLMAVGDRYLHTDLRPPEPTPVPPLGQYPWDAAQGPSPLATPPAQRASATVAPARVGILFYRAHYLAGNTAPIDSLCQALQARGLHPLPLFVSSLQSPDIQADLRDWLRPKDAPGVDLLLNTTSFAIAKLNTATPQLDLWQQLDVPVLQVILSGGTQAAWRQNPMGLSPRDIAMNVALPEVDGRIITRAVSFKTAAQRSDRLETDVVTYEPVGDRIQFVADLAANWVTLRRTPVAERRIALVLANYPNRDGRLANGVGLDTPQSCVEILKALQAEGYTVTDIPQDGDDLIQRLTTGVTNDPESWAMRPITQTLSMAEYKAVWAQLPPSVQAGMKQQWGRPDEERSRYSPPPDDAWPIAGLQLGNVFVGIQPSRGYDLDPSLNYHAPDLVPTHAYLAFYTWLRQQFGAQAIVHVGKHGNLEWLPGKGIGLSADCYPEAMLGAMPHLYPFIVNDPGEGAQAKRRAQAVIVDHLTPPLTRAELYGPLQQLEGLVDEYYEAQSLDPSRLPAIRDRLLDILKSSHLLEDFAGDRSATLAPTTAWNDDQFATLLPSVDGYLCELKEAQIRDGLHILGRCPTGRQLRDLVVAIARHPAGERVGLTRAIAQAWHLDLDPLTDDLGQTWQLLADHAVPPSQRDELASCRTVGDGVAILEAQAQQWVEALIADRPLPADNSPLASALATELQWLQTSLLPHLRQTDREISALLAGLDGRYVPSGPAGAPTRNRPDVLPTGRNFYSVDIRAIPTESAWDVGRNAAEVLVEHYTQENGEYPQSLGLSVWGTSTMRTGGDDIAEALALLGVRPVWDGPSRRVVDFEILPIALLGRPRVDVTLRVSGFFRDAFPNLIDLFDQAVEAVAALPETADENPLAAKVNAETATWQRQGLTAAQAQARSRYRIFGSKPGAYGAGLQGLIEAQNWTTDEDLARAYVNWSSYAYGRHAQGRSAPEAFQARLETMQVVLHNQDNREHDLLDSDDYYQFQGGLTAAVKAASGRSPHTYFGDHAVAENPKVRSLAQEIARVYRSRVVNPKWIAGVKRHGYKGAFEMAATVDYLFAYDATTHCVADHMYTGVAQAYVLDDDTRAFVQKVNPWALRDMAERLLEAHQRQLWADAPAEMLATLRDIVHTAEADIEGHQQAFVN
ncbi:cobaltochelatase subunit CobN [Leptolyngbya iicbica]|uniref:Cobaltochelatase subunit CobN n=2 Tax=Cyanophyceae TaxID=3028117 RepID=A0A4Q7E369_9CYAN|nr:cobaltochelatase subunit CobN [Leptolyngbya sp. LK]RZM75682.1 cobaltochelatase subunit CobN [Leptolyngbya sp. LK]